jgi:hypothetical protein
MGQDFRWYEEHIGILQLVVVVVVVVGFVCSVLQRFALQAGRPTNKARGILCLSWVGFKLAQLSYFFVITELIFIK